MRIDHRYTSLLLYLSIIYAQNGICGRPDININNKNISKPILCSDNQLYIRNPVNEYSFECMDVVNIEQFNTSNTKYFVEKNEYDNNRITLEALASLATSFNHSTPLANNLSNTYGIKNAEESIFGYPPNKDNTGIVNIVILDIRDNFNGSGNFIAGYFDQNDQTDNYFSNKKDVVYIDCNPVDMISSNPVEAIYTLAHEYEHLLHYNSDQYEAVNNPWLDEGLADLAPSILGLGHRNYGYYLANTSIGLDDWVSNELPYYSKSALFLQYIYEYEDLGLEFIKTIFNDSDHQRLESIKLNYYDFVFDKNFNAFFDEWIVNTILDNYPISECLNDLTPQNNITLDLQEELLISTLNIPAYSSYHTFIPDNTNKDQLIELSQNETSFLINLTNNILIENYENGIWDFPENNYNYTYIHSFVNHEISNQYSEYILMINSFKNFHQVNYDNDEIFAYVDIGNKDRWFGGIKYFIENKSLITSIDFKVINDTPITINILKGDFDYTPQSSTYICSPTGTGWNNINLTQSGIFVENEYLFVVIEFYDNAIAYSEYFNDITNSYYSLNGNSFSNINNVTFPSSGDNLYGNWAIRATYIDSNFISIKDTIDTPNLYPNPFLPKLNSNISTYILSQTNNNYSIDIYNLQGKHIINLYNDRPPIDKFLNLTWDGIDKSGLKPSSGLYLLVHNTGEIVASEKILLIY